MNVGGEVRIPKNPLWFLTKWVENIQIYLIAPETSYFFIQISSMCHPKYHTSMIVCVRACVYVKNKFLYLLLPICIYYQAIHSKL